MITWRSLVLEGFGRFERPVRLDLWPGANVLVADNEQGKSTLMAGLCAILFGLEGGDRAAGFTDGRWRSWYRAGGFRGALAFDCDGQQYLIERDFAARNVRLMEADPGGWRTLADERHHAGVQRRGQTYAAAAAGLLGLTDRRLFEATFYLRQPLPAVGQLDAAVQGLLSGGGGAFTAAVAQLEEQLREITRFTAGLGVTSRDAHNDRRLEQVQGRLARLRSELATNQQLVDSLEALGKEVSLARQQHEQARLDAASARELAQAWQRWTGLRSAYHSAIANQLAGSKALSEATAVAADLQATGAALAGYPEVTSVQSDSGGTGALQAKLAGLRSTAREAAELSDAAALLEASVANKAEANSELELLLAGPYAQVCGRPGLLATYDRLASLEDELRQLSQRHQGLLEAQQQIAAAVDAGADWSLLGPAPAHTLHRLRAVAGQLAVAWPAAQSDAGALERVETELAEAYPDLAGPVVSSANEAATGWGAETDDEALAADARLLEQLRLQYLQLLDAASANPDLAALDDPWQAQVAVQQRLDELAIEPASEPFRGRAARPGPGRRRARERMGGLRRIFWPAVGAGGAVGLAAFWLARGSAGVRDLASAVPWVLAGVGVASVLMALAWTVTAARGGAGQGQPDSWPESCGLPSGAELSLLGSWAGLALSDLSREANRLAGHIAAVSPLLLSGLTVDQSLRELEQRLAAATDRLGPSIAQASDPVAAVAAYRRLRSRQSALQHAIASRLHILSLSGEAARVSVSGRAVRALLAAPWDERLAEPWLDLRLLAKLCGIGADCPAGLVAWLQDLDASWWTARHSEAVRWQELTGELRLAQGRLSDFSAPGSPVQMEALRAQADDVAATLAPFELSFPRAKLTELLDECAASQHRLALGRQALERDREELERVKSRLQAVQAEQARLRTELSLLLTAAGGDLEVAARRVDEASGIARKHEQLEQRLQGVLRSQGAGSLEELEISKLKLDSRVASASDAWDRLIEQFPALPPRDLAEDAAHVASVGQRLSAAQSRSEAELEQAASRVSDLLQSRAKVEAAGFSPNLVLAGQEIAELERQARQLELHAKALALAHRQIAAAIQEYQVAYRERLASTATAHFRALTGGLAGRGVVLDESFQVHLSVGAGQIDLIQPASLSQGAQDQLYVAMRLAIADLLAGRVALPLIFDDPFLTFDPARTESMRATFAAISQARQVLLLTHRPEYAAWGRAVAPEVLTEWPLWEVG